MNRLFEIAQEKISNSKNPKIQEIDPKDLIDQVFIKNDCSDIDDFAQLVGAENPTSIDPTSGASASNTFVSLENEIIKSDVKLIIIDSIHAIHKNSKDPTPIDDPSYLNSSMTDSGPVYIRFSRMISRLRKIAADNAVAVIVTNRTKKVPNPNRFGPQFIHKSYFGDFWSYSLNLRLFLSKSPPQKSSFRRTSSNEAENEKIVIVCNFSSSSPKFALPVTVSPVGCYEVDENELTLMLQNGPTTETNDSLPEKNLKAPVWHVLYDFAGQ